MTIVDPELEARILSRLWASLCRKFKLVLHEDSITVVDCDDIKIWITQDTDDLHLFVISYLTPENQIVVNSFALDELDRLAEALQVMIMASQI